MVEVNNPFLEPLREARKLGDPAQIFELEEKSRAWTQEKIAELTGGKQIVDDKIKEIKPAFGVSKFPTLSKQYKEACLVYKSLMELVDESRKLKKSLREEIDAKRKKKDDIRDKV